MSTEESKKSETVTGGCHCGYIKYSMTLSPPLYERETNQCNCSACTRLGYLLLYPPHEDVVWHNGSRERLTNYRFNTKAKDQMFCPKCGTSIGIDFRDVHIEKDGKRYYGISARTIDNVKLDKLPYRYFNGTKKVQPAGDTAGTWWDEEKGEMR